MAVEFNQLVAEAVHPLEAGTPGAADIDGSWVSLKKFDRLAVVLCADAAAEAITVTLTQAQDASGTGAKALTVDVAWVKDSGETAFTMTRYDGAATAVLPAGDTSDVAAMIVETMGEKLDVTNGFTHVKAVTTGVTARVISLTYLLTGGRYQPAAEVDPNG